jgi:hypothetical protein
LVAKDVVRRPSARLREPMGRVRPTPRGLACGARSLHHDDHQYQDDAGRCLTRP